MNSNRWKESYCRYVPKSKSDIICDNIAKTEISRVSTNTSKYADKKFFRGR
jgi:hypothetical protein